MVPGVQIAIQSPSHKTIYIQTTKCIAIFSHDSFMSKMSLVKKRLMIRNMCFD